MEPKVITINLYTVSVRVLLTIRLAISQGRTARWEQSRMVGGLQVTVSCQVGRAREERTGGYGNFENFTNLFASKRSDRKKSGMDGLLRNKSLGWGLRV